MMGGAGEGVGGGGVLEQEERLRQGGQPEQRLRSRKELGKSEELKGQGDLSKTSKGEDGGS